MPQPVCHYEGSPYVLHTPEKRKTEKLQGTKQKTHCQRIREQIISDHLPGPAIERAPDKEIQTFNTDIVLPASPQAVSDANHTGYCALTGLLTGPYEYDDMFGGAYHVWDAAESGESSHRPSYCGHISASPVVLDQILALCQPMQNAVTLYTPSCPPLWLRSGTNSSLPLCESDVLTRPDSGVPRERLTEVRHSH